MPREGVFVDFFASKAATVTTVAQLYLKKNIPVVPVFLHYEGDAIVLDVLPEIDFPAAGKDTAAVTGLTQQLTRLIEDAGAEISRAVVLVPRPLENPAARRNS